MFSPWHSSMFSNVMRGGLGAVRFLTCLGLDFFTLNFIFSFFIEASHSGGNQHMHLYQPVVSTLSYASITVWGQ